MKDETVAKRGSDAIQTFLQENGSQLDSTDLASLSRLQTIVHSGVSGAARKQNGSFAKLEQTIEKTIQFINDASPIKKSAESEENADLIRNASPEQVSAFVGSLRSRLETDPIAFKMMAFQFLAHATEDAKGQFFRAVGDDKKFLNALKEGSFIKKSAEEENIDRIRKASPEQISDFLESLRSRWATDPMAFKAMATQFFAHASPEAIDQLFGAVRKGEEAFLKDLLGVYRG